MYLFIFIYIYYIYIYWGGEVGELDVGCTQYNTFSLSFLRGTVPGVIMNYVACVCKQH